MDSVLASRPSQAVHSFRAVVRRAVKSFQPDNPLNRNRQNASRIAGKLAFDRLFRLGKRFTVGPVMAKVVADDAPRLGIAVSKKYGNAAKRNLFKRRVRAAFQNRLAELPPIAAVISPVPGMKDIRNGAISRLMDGLVNHDH